MNKQNQKKYSRRPAECKRCGLTKPLDRFGYCAACDEITSGQIPLINKVFVAGELTQLAEQIARADNTRHAH